MDLGELYTSPHNSFIIKSLYIFKVNCTFYYTILIYMIFYYIIINIIIINIKRIIGKLQSHNKWHDFCLYYFW